jgi:molecular chaperone GrpE
MTQSASSSDQTKPTAAEAASAASAAAAAAAAAVTATTGNDNGAAAVKPAGPDPTARLAELEGQIGDLTDRLLRAHAEMDNMRKRFEREKAEAQKYAISKFARDVVAVSDNFERAIGAVPKDAASQSPALASLLEGVTLTERELLNVMERHGVKRIDPKGEAFNPHLHQAVMEQEDASVASGTVLQVYQSGYVIEDRILRPAMVVVSRGGAKSSKPADTAAAPPAPEPPKSGAA